MEYRLDLTSMDKDTILFVRKNRYALAYHWDYYQTVSILVSKRFTYDPPTAVYFKAGEGFDSWVDYRLAIEDGKYQGIIDPKEACEYAYEQGNRLLSDTTPRTRIPNTIYVDADGYEYYIPIDDGTITPALCERLNAGNYDYSEIGIEQCSVYNLSIPFSQRHLMDDLKLTFKTPAARNNNITTFNMLTVPTVPDETDPLKSYIRNALRMSTYNDLDTIQNAVGLPLSPIVGNSPKYIPHINTDPEEERFNRFFMSTRGWLYKIASNNTLSVAQNLINLDFTNIEVPPLLSAAGNPDDARTDEELQALYPIRYLVVAPGPEENMFIAYDADFYKSKAPKNYHQYALTRDAGETWIKFSFDQIFGDLDDFRTFIEDEVLPTNDITIQDASGTVDISEESIPGDTGSIEIIHEIRHMGIAFLPYPIKADKLCVAIITDAHQIKYFETEDGISWAQFVKPTNLGFIIDPIIGDPIGYHNALFAKNLYTPQLITNTYVDSNGNIISKNASNIWEIIATVDEIKTFISDGFNDRVVHDAPIENTEYNVVYRYDIETNLLQVGYAIISFGLDPNDPASSYDRRETVKTYMESGTFFWRKNDDDSHSILNHTPIHKTIEEVMVKTNQPDKDVAYGDFMVNFRAEDVYFIDGKWIIRDILGPLFAGDGTGFITDNTDKAGGFKWRVSEDFIHWFPVKGMYGESLPNSIGAHLFTDNAYVMVFVVQDEKAYTYAMARKNSLHYNFRVNAHKWYGVNITQQMKALYIKTNDKTVEYQTDDPPTKIGFSFDLNPDASILVYNGVPILDGTAYVNPNNKREMIVSEMIAKNALQQEIMPIQYRKNNRKYIADDFTIIVASAADPTKEVHAFTAPGKVFHAGKEVYVDFNSDIAGDFILFNGINHEYVILGKRSIKYIFSRYGLSEVIYGGNQFNTIGHANYKAITDGIYRLQFILTDKQT